VLIRVKTSFPLFSFGVLEINPIIDFTVWHSCVHLPNRRLYHQKPEERIQTACPLSCGPSCIENQIDLTIDPLQVPLVRPTPLIRS